MQNTTTTARKAPKQERAIATVEAILEATAQILVSDGYAHASTNRIAKRAGVSVGSLYQYFPNKDAVIAALVERFAKRQMESLSSRLTELGDMPIQEAILELVKALLEVRHLEPELHRVLFEQLPPIVQIELFRDWSDGAILIVMAAMHSRADELRIENAELTAYLLINACHGIIHNTVINRPDLLSGEALAQETALLIWGYLKK